MICCFGAAWAFVKAASCQQPSEGYSAVSVFRASDVFTDKPT